MLAFIQAIAIMLSLGPKAVTTTNWFNYLTIGLCLTAGAMIVMWLEGADHRERHRQRHAVIIFTGIVARVPMQIIALVETAVIDATMIWTIPAFAAFVLVIITGVTFVDLGEQRIPVQYAKRVVGRKMYGGQNTHIDEGERDRRAPLIFAMTLLQFPGMIAGFWPESGFNIWYQAWMGPRTPINLVLMALLIVFFTYFYTTISFNP